MSVVVAWVAGHQIPQMRQHFAQFGDRLPQGIHDQMEALEKRLEQS